NLVTADGFLISPQITIPTDAQSISVGADGTVSVLTASNPTTPSVVNTLQLVRFPNPAGLSSEGSNLYSASASSGAAQTGNPGQNGAGFIRQAFLERSNVDVVQELVHLILAQRAYEFNTKAVRADDAWLSSTNTLTRWPGEWWAVSGEGGGDGDEPRRAEGGMHYALRTRAGGVRGVGGGGVGRAAGRAGGVAPPVGDGGRAAGAG